MKFTSYLGRVFGLLVVPWVLSGPVHAIEAPDSTWINAANTKLESARTDLNRVIAEGADSAQLIAIQKMVAPLRIHSQECVQVSEKALQKQRSNLESLGPLTPGDSGEVVQARGAVMQQIERLETRIAACRYILFQTREIRESMTRLERKSLTEELLLRGHHLGSVIQGNLQTPSAWLSSINTFFRDKSGLQLLGPGHLIALTVIALLAFVPGRAGRRALLRGLEHEPDGRSAPVAALRTCSACMLPALASAVSVAVYLLAVLPLSPLPFVTQMACSVIILLLLLAMVCAVLTPIPPAKHHLSLAAPVAVRLGQRLKVLLVVGFIGILLFEAALVNILPEPQYLMARAIYGTFLIINLAWITWILGRLPGMAGSWTIRLVLIAGLFAILGAEWLGYRNLSQYFITGLLGSLLSLGLAWIVARFLSHFLDGFDSGFYPWQKRLRRRMQLKPNETLPGLIWLRVALFLTVWITAAIWALKAWGLSSQGIDIALTTLREGFSIGTAQIKPIQIGFGIVIFVILYTLSGWLKRTFIPERLKNTRLDRGAQEALVTVTGYIGLALAMLVGLSLAGVEFRNLAIIAGALSLGIGFGLQNIVNNFVSGLILLIERPVRTGDWVVVGATEGYVRKISIRSTQIETFDRADVIVPNSELISGQVTNWMLNDPWGRVIVPVGVAYGSDTRKVTETLLSVAQNHELVMTDGRGVSPPRVIFRGFGDSSLNFELRCFISIVDRRLQVSSDLCYAIDAAFDEAGIQIPFPQRDMHVRDWTPGRKDVDIPDQP